MTNWEFTDKGDDFLWVIADDDDLVAPHIVQWTPEGLERYGTHLPTDFQVISSVGFGECLATFATLEHAKLYAEAYFAGFGDGFNHG